VGGLATDLRQSSRGNLLDRRAPRQASHLRPRCASTEVVVFSGMDESADTTLLGAGTLRCAGGASPARSMNTAATPDPQPVPDGRPGVRYVPTAADERAIAAYDAAHDDPEVRAAELADLRASQHARDQRTRRRARRDRQRAARQAPALLAKAAAIRQRTAPNAGTFGAWWALDDARTAEHDAQVISAALAVPAQATGAQRPRERRDGARRSSSAASSGDSSDSGEPEQPELARPRASSGGSGSPSLLSPLLAADDDRRAAPARRSRGRCAPVACAGTASAAEMTCASRSAVLASSSAHQPLNSPALGARWRIAAAFASSTGAWRAAR